MYVLANAEVATCMVESELQRANLKMFHNNVRRDKTQ
jgi:hypothetical protein